MLTLENEEGVAASRASRIGAPPSFLFLSTFLTRSSSLSFSLSLSSPNHLLHLSHLACHFISHTADFWRQQPRARSGVFRSL